MEEWRILHMEEFITIGPSAQCVTQDITVPDYIKTEVIIIGKCPNHHICPRFRSDWCQGTSGSRCRRRKDDDARFSRYELRKQVLDHELDCKTHEHNVKTFVPTCNSYNTMQLSTDLRTIIEDMKALV